MAAFYEDLIIWQKAMDIAEKVYALTKTLPADEIYGLSSQMRRSAVSIPSNIAEGHARSGSHKEFKHFLTIAKGSLAELETQIVANIASLQKVIAPMQDMYNAVAVGPGIPVADGMSVEKMQAELASLQQKVLIQNERNRSLLRAHITQIRGQLAGMNAMNPYRGRTSVYAERGAVSSSVVLEA